MKLRCWNCGHALDDVPRPISRHAACAQCFNELHCCRLCRHYDPKRNMQCFEDRADPPLQKENANFCDFFSPSADAYQAQTTDKGAQAKSALSALFGATEGEDAPKTGNEAGKEALQTDEQPPEEPNAAGEAEQPPALTPEELARRKLDDLFG